MKLSDLITFKIDTPLKKIRANAQLNTLNLGRYTDEELEALKRRCAAAGSTRYAKFIQSELTLRARRDLEWQ